MFSTRTRAIFLTSVDTYLTFQEKKLIIHHWMGAGWRPLTIPLSMGHFCQIISGPVCLILRWMNSALFGESFDMDS